MTRKLFGTGKIAAAKKAHNDRRMQAQASSAGVAAMQAAAAIDTAVDLMSRATPDPADAAAWAASQADLPTHAAALRGNSVIP